MSTYMILSLPQTLYSTCTDFVVDIKYYLHSDMRNFAYLFLPEKKWYVFRKMILGYSDRVYDVF